MRDWIYSQWENGAYTETSIWQDLNDYAGIGHGAGETVWASAPPVLTVRHFQHYDDMDFLRETLPNHHRWLVFLNREFNSGMKDKGYTDDLKGYKGDGSGLGDWLALRDRDTFLTHIAFYMASARAVAYISNVLSEIQLQQKASNQADIVRERISRLYMKNGKDTFDFPEGENVNVLQSKCRICTNFSIIYQAVHMELRGLNWVFLLVLYQEKKGVQY